MKRLWKDHLETMLLFIAWVIVQAAVYFKYS